MVSANCVTAGGGTLDKPDNTQVRHFSLPLIDPAGYCIYQRCRDLPGSRLWRITALAIAPLILLMFWATSIQYYFDILFPFLVIVMIASLFRAGPIWAYSN